MHSNRYHPMSSSQMGQVAVGAPFWFAIFCYFPSFLRLFTFLPFKAVILFYFYSLFVFYYFYSLFVFHLILFYCNSLRSHTLYFSLHFVLCSSLLLFYSFIISIASLITLLHLLLLIIFAVCLDFFRKVFKYKNGIISLYRKH